MTGTRTRATSVSTAPTVPERGVASGGSGERPGDDGKADREDKDGGNRKGTGKSQKPRTLPKKGATCKGGPQRLGCDLKLQPTDIELFIECDMCKSCYHPQCQGLSDDAYNAHSEHNFIWLCTECEPKFFEAVDIGRRIEARIDKVEKNILSAVKGNKPNEEIGQMFENKMQSMEKSVVDQIKEQHAKTEQKLKEQEEAVQAVPRVSEELRNSAHEIKEIMRRKDDKDMREKNVLLHNIPECGSQNPEERKDYDLASFQNVVSALFNRAEADDMEVVNVIRWEKGGK